MAAGERFIRRHGGLPPSDVALPEPPDAIGELQSADAEQGAGKGPVGFVRRIGRTLAATIYLTVVPGFIAAGIVGVLGMAKVYDLKAHASLAGGIVVGIAVLGGLFGLVAGYLGSAVAGHYTYVGAEGLARRTYTGKPEVDARSKVEVLLFSETEALTAKRTRKFVNGAYSETTYKYTWRKRDRELPFVISGSYSMESGDPLRDDPYHFAAAAERAWNVHLSARASEQFARESAMAFGLGILHPGKSVRVGYRSLEFVDAKNPSKTERWSSDDIESIDVRTGIITVKRRGRSKSWFSSDGVFRFDLNDMDNSAYFLIALRELAGFTFAGA